jgi:hypothetical protein
MLKQMNADLRSSFESIQKELSPLKKFIADIQQEIAEEEKNA